VIRVKFHAGWTPDDEYDRKWISKYTKDGNTWNNLQLVGGDDYDFIVIFNHPRKEYFFGPWKRFNRLCPWRWHRFPANRAIVFQGEPSSIRATWGAYAAPDPSRFFRVFSTDKNFNSVGWSFDLTWSELSNSSIHKTKLFSGVQSAKSSTIAQQRRLHFWKQYLSTYDEFSPFGRDFGVPTTDKVDAILPFKYTFAAENSYERNYFTEKITDAIVGEALCFYDGCPNIEEHYDPRALIKLDLGEPARAFEIVKKAIAENEWEQRIAAIRREKHRILNELQPMPLVEMILREGGQSSRSRSTKAKGAG